MAGRLVCLKPHRKKEDLKKYLSLRVEGGGETKALAEQTNVSKN